MRSVFMLIIMMCVLLQACDNKQRQSTIMKAVPSQGSNPSPTVTPESNTIDMGSINEDLDSDGKSEQIRLVYNTNLMLQVGDSSIVVTNELPNPEESNAHMYLQKPAISVLQTDKQQKAVLVSIVWETNKIGSTAELWIFDYQNNAIHKIWHSGDDSNMHGKAEYHQDSQFVSVQFPEYGINQNIELDETQKEWIGRLAESSAEHEALLPDLTEYKVTLTPDGQSELITKRLLAFDSAPFYLSPFYTHYRINDGKVVAVRAIMNTTDVFNNNPSNG